MRIAITGGKGGTGKSTVATSLAIMFAKTKKTMLVDADAECPNDYLLMSAKLEKYSTITQLIPKFDLKKCTKCGKCASICKQNAIVFVKDKYPAFVPDVCIGCKACIVVCPNGAISETKKEIGTIYFSKKYNVNLVSAELKLGELASGEVVVDVREKADEISKKLSPKITLIDSAAGIGCPVIASISGTDFVIAVTEPTPSALNDLKRVLFLARHFQIPHGIIINKHNLSTKFCKKIEFFAKQNNIPIIGKIPYKKEVVESTVNMRPLIKTNKAFEKEFEKIVNKINDLTKNIY